MSRLLDTLQSQLHSMQQVGTVTYLTVRQAAEKVGISRQTMFRNIKDGKVSATLDRDGQKQIDVSELIRVFGNLKSLSSKATVASDRSRLTQRSEATPAQPYQVELEKLRVQLEFKELELSLARERIDELKVRETQAAHRERDILEERNRLIGVIEQQNRLLVAPTAAPRSKGASTKKVVAQPSVMPTKPSTVEAKTVPTKSASKTPAKKRATKN